jgi:hypothetical protein
MMQYLVKTLISALLIVVVSECSKKNQWLGGIIAALPLLSILAMVWLYWETKNVDKVINLSYGVFWMVLPSLPFFLILPMFLRKEVPFFIALVLSCLVLFLIYISTMWIYNRAGIKL